MRHHVAGVRLSRTTEHRKALFSNLIAALFTHDKIRTTHPKARETRRLAERTITLAKRLSDVLAKKPEKRTPHEAARVVHAIRLARQTVRDRDAVMRLFDEIAPRFAGRAGGYTRIVKLGQRPGDAAPMSLLELMPDEAAAKKPAEKGSDKGAAKAKGEAKVEAKSESGEAKAKGDKGEKKPKAVKAKGAEAEGAEPKAAKAKAAKPKAEKKKDE